MYKAKLLLFIFSLIAVSSVAVYRSEVYHQSSSEDKAESYLSTSPAAIETAAQSDTAAATISNPFAGKTFYVDPNSFAAQDEKRLRSAGRIADANLIKKISSNPHVFWFGGWNTDVTGDVRRRIVKIRDAGHLPVVGIYHIPRLNCAAGVGAKDGPEYRAWIDKFAAGVGTERVVVILEGDALPMADCLTASQRTTRYNLLRYAVNTLSALEKTSVYVDMGNANWHTADEMVKRWNDARLNNAKGFSLNVAGFQTTVKTKNYGNAISKKLGNRHFVIDTGRNGTGPNPDNIVCNAPGLGLGSRPTSSTPYTRVDAFLWVKPPGESDGNWGGCDKAFPNPPPAGAWWRKHALMLAQNASF